MFFFVVLVAGEIRASGFDHGFWLGYTHGVITPLVPQANVNFHRGYWSGWQAGYDYSLSPKSRVSFGVERSAAFRYQYNGLSVPNSFLTGASFLYHYYPLEVTGESGGKRWTQKIRPFAAFGLSGLYWSNKAMEKDAGWKGLYLLPAVSLGAGLPLGDYTFLHAGIGSRVSLAGPDHKLDGFSINIRISYDFHIREQEVLMQSHLQIQALADDLRERTDSMSQELQEEMDKVKYAVSEYEAILKRMMSTIDSIEAVNRKIKVTYADTLSELRKLRKAYYEIRQEYDSIRWNTWDTITVVATNDTTGALRDPLKLTRGAYLVLYTGEANQVTRRLYEEIGMEYEHTWLIKNDFGVQRVMIWVPEEKLGAEWLNLSSVFTNLNRFTPVIR